MSRTALPPSQGEGGDAQGINRWVNQAGKVKLFVAINVEIHVFGREKPLGVPLLAPLQVPGSPAVDAQCSGWLKLFIKITPKCLGTQK